MKKLIFIFLLLIGCGGNPDLDTRPEPEPIIDTCFDLFGAECEELGKEKPTKPKKRARDD